MQLEKKGNSFKAQGSPPILAHIWTRILLQIEKSALFDFSIVEDSTTYEGTGISVNRSLFNWVYNAFGIPLVPGIINTHPIT